jgi:hypothetical protein
MKSKPKDKDGKSRRSQTKATSRVLPSVPPNENLPPVETLAVMASILVTDGRRPKPDFYVDKAFDLWKAAKNKCEAEADNEHRLNLLGEEIDQQYKDCLLPEKFPIGFDEFLHLLFPTVQKNSERQKCFRDFLGATNLNSGTSEPIGSLNAGDLVADFKRRSFNRDDYLRLVEDVEFWWKNELHRKKSRRNVAAAA